MDTPYQWTKQVASHWGGTRNGTIVHWPKGIKAKGEIRSQFCHVIDVAPTILEAAGMPEPTFVNGVQQSPIEGDQHAYCFNDANAPERHETQYFEMSCNRGIYHKGWSAVTRHRTPWVIGQPQLPPSTTMSGSSMTPAPTGRRRSDLAQGDAREAPRAAAAVADRSHQIQRAAAGRPRAERFNPGIAGRPHADQGNSQLLFAGMGRLSENSVVVDEEQVLLDHGRGGGAAKRAPRASSSPRAASSAAGASMPKRARRSSPTTSSA